MKQHEIPCEYEASDGHKHIDIAIHDAKLYIEIDGKHHITDFEQHLADLKRDTFSQQDGYITKRYSNKDIEENLDKITNVIVEFVKYRMRQLYYRVKC